MLLRGMDCEQFTAKFSEAKISLEEFLTISDARLKEIGIEFPYQRNIIKRGIHKFYKAKWSRHSLFIPNYEKDLTSMDLIMVLSNILRQLVVMKAHLVYIKQLGDKAGYDKPYANANSEILIDLKRNIKELEKRLQKQIPKKMPNPLLIQKNKIKQSSCVKYVVALAAVPIIVIGAFKLQKLFKF